MMNKEKRDRLLCELAVLLLSEKDLNEEDTKVLYCISGHSTVQKKTVQLKLDQTLPG